MHLKQQCIRQEIALAFGNYTSSKGTKGKKGKPAVEGYVM
jgi:hypothetical protein